MKTFVLNLIRSLLFKNTISEKCLFYLTNGRKWNHFFAKLPANYYQYSKNSIRKVIRNGIIYELDISDYMEWLIYFGIIAEPREVLYSLIKPGFIIFDIGSNIGETTLNFAKLTGTSGMVYSFEPDKYCFDKLLKNISNNSFKNIKPINIGLGNEEGDFFLASENPYNKGGNKVIRNADKKPNIIIKTLDSFVNSENISKIDFIKIDVEGFEYNVLKGGINAIAKFRPILFIEINDKLLRMQSSSAQQVVNLLEKYYSNIVIAETNEKITSTYPFNEKHFDIIAKP
ncbi:MAG: FkbM family methyltransferase [Bacteroidia bacterium]